MFAFGAVSLWVDTQTSISFHVEPRMLSHYRDDILDAHEDPYAGTIGDDFLLQDDNVTPHRARIMEA